MTGQNGSQGRQFIGDTLDLSFAKDESLTSAKGRGNVRVDLPGAADSPARSVAAREFDASGEAGKGLTQARFSDNVEYREEAQRGGSPRTAKSRTLVIALVQDSVSNAAFTGAVKFDEQGLQASGAQAKYDPVKGTLSLSGSDAGGGPRVADAQVTVEADTINVALQGRTMSAAGNLKTTLRPRTTTTAGATPGRAAAGDNGKLPGLLEQGQPANVNGNSLEYHGAAGTAVYTGNAALVQGETAVRADTVTIDQESGDLIASGNARSTLMLDMGVTIGSAAEIRYEDATRLISYNPPPTPVGVAVASAAQSHLSGPQGDVRADRIEVKLASGEDRADQLEAYGNVNVRLDMRVATGARLTYFSEDERYVLSGAPNVGVRVVEGCRETTGKTVTFFKSSDRIIVDGNEELRTQTKRGAGPCPESRTR
jgi:lipopolysaccharide export system protein LptA